MRKPFDLTSEMERLFFNYKPHAAPGGYSRTAEEAAAEWKRRTADLKPSMVYDGYGNGLLNDDERPDRLHSHIGLEKRK